MKNERIMKRSALFLAVCTALAFTAGTAFAKGDEANLEKLGSFKRTDTQPGKSVAQGGKYAENLKKVLQRIRMPEGFKIELFAIVPDAREMAVSRNKATVWVGTRKSTVWSVTDRDMDNVADTVDEFSPSVKFDDPGRHLLLARRVPVRGRAQPGDDVPGGGVLHGESRHRGRPDRQAG